MRLVRLCHQHGGGGGEGLLKGSTEESQRFPLLQPILSLRSSERPCSPPSSVTETVSGQHTGSSLLIYLCLTLRDKMCRLH